MHPAGVLVDWNYLRMRGEELITRKLSPACTELPPHARRRVLEQSVSANRAGITSACAEKRDNARSDAVPPRNYLRMRGEELPALTITRLPKELPPHARRRDPHTPRKESHHGITSACAEKSSLVDAYFLSDRNYLRMRGEESSSRPVLPIWLELPPHARRRVTSVDDHPASQGITSACAEKSTRVILQACLSRNYLRMRGEELFGCRFLARR